MNKKLNVLFISGWYPTKISPQNGDFVKRHAEAVATKHNVYAIHVITNDRLVNKAEIENYKENNVQTTIIYVPKYGNLIFKFYTFLKAYLKSIKTVDNVDVVHLNISFPKGIIALYLKWFKKIPFIITEHWTGYLYPNNKSIKYLEKLVTKIIIKNASFVCPVSDNLKNNMVQFGLLGNYYPIPNVVDTSIFNISNDASSDHFEIIHISHMRDEAKNVSGILDTIGKLQKHIPNLKLHLIGNKSNLYIDKIKNLGIANYKITNEIPHNEIPIYLNKADVFVLFSNYENLPCVILEAFSCGLPVISTNVGGIKEFFPNNFGKLINSKDENQLFIELLNIYNKKYELASKHEMHNYVVNHFSKATICERFSKLYHQSLAKK
ncbi:glycosyltransferase [Lutibacter maritimus]|uniref:Glycosyltransferase involved in cell wall bisynthesis n=1 Tax=Lutibacter maritimus TaxID=593133 RepID=A0A1I6R6P8_9FLAO|nr:glycosyltransferase [Lutibacter maritimus]SFS60349.1 Glycosyltransferase involved in cell wall bisynthesis [Lutibacter maritimus]